MHIAHLIFLSLYALQTSGSYVNSEGHQGIEKRSFLHLFSGSHSHHSGSSSGSGSSSHSSSGSESSESSSGSSSDSSSGSSSDSRSKHSDSESANETTVIQPSKSVTPTHPSSTGDSGFSETTTLAQSHTSNTQPSSSYGASKTSTADGETSSNNESGNGRESKGKKEEKKNSLSKFGEVVKDLAIEAVGGIIVDVAVNEIMNGNSHSSDGSSSSTSGTLQAVQFVITDSNGSIETTTITAPTSDFSTGSNGVLYLKTDATSDLVNAESSYLYASTATSSLI